MKNIPLGHKIACTIIYGAYGALFIYFLTLLYAAVDLGIELSAWPVVLISLTVLICITTIVGIWKNNRILLILGIVLAAVKLLDTVSAIVNRIFFQQPINVWLTLAIGVLFLYVFLTLLRGVRHNKVLTQ
ncbi:MAG: hypothetical protein RJB39_85 [Candidatus Parcubacteria bacterium]|jgi:hypothetical protein